MIMDLCSINLFIAIDTQYFVTNFLNFESKDLSAPSKLSNRGFINIFLVDITVMEIKKKIMMKFHVHTKNLVIAIVDI